MSENFKLSPISEIIEDAKKGKMFILVDDENRENEGDLIIPASACNHQQINFMAINGRGLICLALTQERVKKLGLSLMSANNQSKNKTAFTLSIEAKNGITTGISAFDRAKTIADAIDENKGSVDIVSPGHIFPLQAEDGGVLVRAGHTEAAVDIAKLAGLNPAGVICEIMNDDGTMARMPDLITFAKLHNLKIATIADLIEYRRRNEKLIALITERTLATKEYGEFKMRIYRSLIDNIEHIALIKGNLKDLTNSEEPILVRMHHLNIINDCLTNLNNTKSGMLNLALQKINQNKSGIIVIIRQPAESIINLLDDIDNLQQIRNYGIGAQILSDLNISKMTLLTNSPKSVIGFDGYKIKISGYQKLN